MRVAMSGEINWTFMFLRTFLRTGGGEMKSGETPETISPSPASDLGERSWERDCQF